MNERILKFLQIEGINAKQFASEIGVLNSSVSHVLSGRNKPSFDFIQKILNRYNHLSADWLILGKGPMLKGSISTPASTTAVAKPKESNLFSPVSEPIPDAMLSSVISKNELLDKRTDSLEDKPQGDTDRFAHLAVSHSKKSVEKVMIFYADKTFCEYTPEAGENNY
ncbi:MAG: helix-turn-helix transcriptional regulator [Bacteroidales bacterium]|nr:helix-turn-helix transcriptional regulator [Bacteroidales bacterium]